MNKLSVKFSLKILLSAIKLIKSKIFFIIRYKKNSTKSKVSYLFFFPEKSISLHARALNKISTSLNADGIDIISLECYKSLSTCYQKMSIGNDLTKFQEYLICCDCKLNSNAWNIQYSREFIKLDTSKKSISNELQKLNYNSLLEYEYKNIKIGKLIYYDLSIFFKKVKDRYFFYDEELKYFIKLAQDAILLIDNLEKIYLAKAFDGLVSYDEYCLPSVAREWARSKNIVAMQAGLAYHNNFDERFIIFSRSKTSLVDRSEIFESWHDISNLPLPPKIINEIYKDLILRMTGNGGHIFSKNYSGQVDKLLNQLKFDKDKKTISVFLSSSDEISALEEMSNGVNAKIKINDAFSSQLTWIKYLIDKRQNSNEQYVIKLHPRLMKNHRDSSIAEELLDFEKILKSKPDNFRIVYPNSSISAYDILSISDQCNTSWGTMGLEIARFGVPVITPITRMIGITPNISLFKKAFDKFEYLSQLDCQVESLKYSDLIEVCRLYYASYLSNAVYTKNIRDIDLPIINFREAFTKNIHEINYKYISSKDKDLVDEWRENEYKEIKESVDFLISFMENKSKYSKDSKLINRLKNIQ